MTWKLGVCGLLLASGALAQPAFEVASVRSSGAITSKNADEAKREMGMQINGAQVDVSMMSLAELVRRAYRLRPSEFSGPAWTSSERYDIHAKLPSGSTQAQVPAMLQTLLTERFKVAFHRESREHQVYALVVGKGGLKLKQVEPDPPGAAGDKQLDMSGGAMHLNRKMTMQALCDFLAGFADRPLVDMTGLTATYQVALEIPFDELKRAKIAAEGRGAVGDTAADPGGGSAMFGAIQQLGLRLEPRKVPIEVLVVDHAERVPVEN
jgi:uncharacterized protein (TIGR03435 family)